jgi:hypothetical protein
VADEGHAPQTQQGRATVLRVIHDAGETGESAFGQQGAQPGYGAGKQGFFKDMGQRRPQTLGKLERHVAYKTIADNNIQVSGKDVASFHIAGKIQFLGLPEQIVGILDQGIALAFLFADGKYAHLGVFAGQHGLGHGPSHESELEEVMGLAVHIGPHIQKHGGLFFFRGQHSGQGQPIHPFNATDDEHGAGHSGPGMPGADEPVGASFLYQTAGHLHGGILFTAQHV